MSLIMTRKEAIKEVRRIDTIDNQTNLYGLVDRGLVRRLLVDMYSLTSEDVAI